MALFARGVVDPWPLHFKTGPPRNGAFDPERFSLSARFVRRPRNLIVLLTAFWLTARAFLRQLCDWVDTPAACAPRGW
jgi:hypothetical protein